MIQVEIKSELKKNGEKLLVGMFWNIFYFILRNDLSDVDGRLGDCAQPIFAVDGALYKTRRYNKRRRNKDGL